jgi:hypothetical protein
MKLVFCLILWIGCLVHANVFEYENNTIVPIVLSPWNCSQSVYVDQSTILWIPLMNTYERITLIFPFTIIPSDYVCETNTSYVLKRENEIGSLVTIGNNQTHLFCSIPSTNIGGLGNSVVITITGITNPGAFAPLWIQLQAGIKTFTPWTIQYTSPCMVDVKPPMMNTSLVGNPFIQAMTYAYGSTNSLRSCLSSHCFVPSSTDECALETSPLNSCSYDTSLFPISNKYKLNSTHWVVQQERIANDWCSPWSPNGGNVTWIVSINDVPNSWNDPIQSINDGSLSITTNQIPIEAMIATPVVIWGSACIALVCVMIFT